VFLNASGGAFHNTSIINNTIKNAKIGMQFVGVSGSVTNNGLISGNTIGDVSEPLTNGGILCGYVDNAEITGNEIFGQAVGNTNSSQFGIYLGTGSTTSKIRKNKIHDFYYTGTGGFGCYGIEYYSDATTETEISNNVIYAIKGDGDTTSIGYAPQGIYIAAGGNCKIYFNSIYLSGNTLGQGTSYDGMSACIGIDADITLLDIGNNILQNSMGEYTGSTMSNVTYLFYSGSANTAYTDINYNDYYFTDQSDVTEYVGYLTSNRADLAAWKTATGKDANSYSVNPGFTSPSNLEPTAGSYLVGTTISGITTDIEGTTRSAPPDLGAYEGSEAGRWLGGTSTDWTTNANWDNGAPPTGSDNVVVNSWAANMPHVTSVPSTNAVCDGLTINTGATVTIDAGKALTVNGTITNTPGASGLVIKSDGTSGTGSLIEASGAPATVERYIPNDLKWHFLSSPVSSQPIWPEFAPTPTGTPLSFGASPWNWDFYYLNPGESLSSPYYWVNLRKANGDYNDEDIDGSGNDAGFGATTPPTLIPGRGYLAAYGSSGTPAWTTTHTFSGNLNQGMVNQLLTYYSDNALYLVGNPYPSSIDWKASTGWSRIGLYNNSGYDYWIFNDAEGNYGTFNSSGTSGTLGTSRDIAPGQAFLVWVNPSGGTFGMDNGIRVHSAQTWLKAEGTGSSEIRLKITSNANSFGDEMIVAFDPSFTGGGSAKLWSFYPEAPEIWSAKNGQYFSIDRNNEPNAALTVPVSVKTGVDASYTILAVDVNDFALSEKVYLDDLKTGGSQELKANPAYSFAAKPGDDPARFRLRFTGPYGVEDPGDRPEFTVYAIGNTVYIKNLTGDVIAGNVHICDMLGRKIAQSRITEKNSEIAVTAPTGVYLVTLVTDRGTYSRKIFIH